MGAPSTFGLSRLGRRQVAQGAVCTSCTGKTPDGRPAELVKKHAPTPAKRLREAARAKRALEKMGHVWQMPSSKESNAHFCRLGRFAEGASRALAVRPTGLGRFAECASRTPVDG